MSIRREYHSKIMDEWLPIHNDLLTELGWVQGTEVEITPLPNDQLLVRRVGALKDNAMKRVVEDANQHTKGQTKRRNLRGSK